MNGFWCGVVLGRVRWKGLSYGLLFLGYCGLDVLNFNLSVSFESF